MDKEKAFMKCASDVYLLIRANHTPLRSVDIKEISHTISIHMHDLLWFYQDKEKKKRNKGNSLLKEAKPYIQAGFDIFGDRQKREGLVDDINKYLEGENQ